ncbi:hypothetical protein P4E94_14765 [Pontiellaceae bacterium B12219]|nr:hypothetical protein [Pontiellaceae bacterium B12219]
MSNKNEIRIYLKSLFDRTGLTKATVGFKKLTSIIKGMGSTGVASFAKLKKGLDALLRPLKIFMAVIGAGGGIFAAFAASSIKSAASMETLRTQLKAVMATKEEADKAFAESVQFSAKTPFSPQEIVETRVALEGVGIEGQGAVEAVATTAAALNKNILDVASSLKSLETEPLRGLGIMLERQGDSFLFKYKDKMKQSQEISATGFEQAQAALMEIMIEKFGGGLEEMSATFNGKLSTLKGAFDLFKADFGEKFLPAVKRVIDDLIEALTGNNLTKFGEKINQHVESARIKVIAAFQTAQEASKIIQDNLATGGTGFGRIVNAVIVNIVDSLFKGLVAAIKASLEIWKLVGITIVSVIKEELLKLDIPGMGKSRKKAAVNAVGNMSNEDARKYLVDNGVYSNEFLNGMPNVSGDEFKGLLMGAINDGDLGKDKEAQLAGQMDGRMVESALKNFADGMKSTVSDLRSDLDMNLEKVGEAVKNTTGVDFNFEESYNQNKKKLWEQRLQELEQEQLKKREGSSSSRLDNAASHLEQAASQLNQAASRENGGSSSLGSVQDQPKKWKPGHVGSDDWKPGQVGSDNWKPGHVGSDDWKPGHVGPDDWKPGHVGSDDWKPGHVGPDDWKPGHVRLDDSGVTAAVQKQNELLKTYLAASEQTLRQAIQHMAAQQQAIENLSNRTATNASQIRNGRS